MECILHGPLQICWMNDMAASRSDALWSLQGLHILIIDDLAQMRTMLREMLVACGADKIESVKNGEEALEAMSRQKPDIVLCDYNLGDGKDGQQVLEEAREHDWLPYSSIFILVTAENTLEMVMGVVEHEPDAYLTKPFTRIVLQQRLRKLQEKKASFAEIASAVERKEYLRACALCDRAIKAGDRYRFDLMKIKGDALQRARDHGQAEAHYRTVLNERELPWAQLGLGQALFHQRRFGEAEQVLQQAIGMKENFVAAHDWLARAQEAQGDTTAAEKTLRRAVELSPKNLRRQKALGEAALENGHLDVAESAFKSVIKEGRNSIFGKPTDFGSLADVYMASDDPEQAGKILGRMHRSYSDAGPEAQLQMAIVDGRVHKTLGNAEAASQAVEKALALFEKQPEALDRSEAMALAETCSELGHADAATKLVQHVVRANHEDEAMLARAREMFAKAGMAEQGEEIISAERKSMIKMNNEAVALAKNGQLKESVSLLLRAAQAMPENVAINLNAAQSLLMLMRQDGCNWRLLRQAQDLLRGISGAASGNARYPKLVNMAQTLERSLDA